MTTKRNKAVSNYEEDDDYYYDEEYYDEEYYDEEEGEYDLQSYVDQVLTLMDADYPRDIVANLLLDTNYDIQETCRLLQKQKPKKTPKKKPAAPPAPPAKPVEKPTPKKQKEESKAATKTPSPTKLVKSASSLNQDYPNVFPEEEAKAGKLSLNLVIIGHVDSGKSTTMGHLLYKMGYIETKTLRKYEKECREIGKESFQYAWVLDGDSDERERGITIDVACKYFETTNRQVTLLDAPGHLDYVPKMISGASQADSAILVIDSSPDGFERGFSQYGQTREHAMLAKSLGINELIVAVNKLELSEWDQGRFTEIEAQMVSFLGEVGFESSKIIFIPISGLAGYNLTEKYEDERLAWYDGPCLIDVVDNLQPLVRQTQMPLRLSIADRYTLPHGSITGQIVSGQLVGGLVRLQDRVIIQPEQVTAQVRDIEVHGAKVGVAYAGQNAEIALTKIDGAFDSVIPGSVLCGVDYVAPIIRKFIIKANTFDIQYPITNRQSLLLFTQSRQVSVKIKRILSLMNSSTGQVIKNRPKFLARHQSGMIEIESELPLCLEKFTNYKFLGKVTMRDNGKTVMSGVVTELIG